MLHSKIENKIQNFIRKYVFMTIQLILGPFTHFNPLFIIFGVSKFVEVGIASFLSGLDFNSSISIIFFLIRFKIENKMQKYESF